MPPTVTPAPYDGAGARMIVAASDDPQQPPVVTGDLGVVRAVTAWASTMGLSVDALTWLDTAGDRLDPARAERLSRQLRRVGQVLRDVPVPALGWERTGEPGLAGGVIGPDLLSPTGAVVVTGSVSAHVVGRDAVLRVRDGKQVTDVTEWVTGTDQQARTPVTGVPLPALGMFGPGQFRVHQVPAGSVAAPLTTTLRELAELCARTSTVLKVATA